MSLSTRKPVAIQIIDAETKQPIMAGARITDTFIQPAQRDYDPWTPSGRDGIVRLKAEPNGKHPVLIQAHLEGYQDDSMPLSNLALEKIESPGLFENTEKRTANFTIALYAGDPFRVQLVVPAEFRGVIKAELDFREDVPLPLGKRLFQSVVTASGPNGMAHVIGPAVLKNVSPERFSAVYNNGNPLDGRMDTAKVGFRWLKAENNSQWYVVGTQKDYDNFRQQYNPEMETPKSEPTSSKGSGGGGGGGRGGRGGGGGGGRGGMGGGGGGGMGMGSGGFN